jgi:hypothetical protein
MDARRLSTGDVLATGILSVPPPDTDIPKDREDVGVDVDAEFVPADGLHVGNTDALRAKLEAGAVLHCSEYYGIPHVWKADDGSYRGTLLQYRAVSEAPTFATADEALEWFVDTAYAVAG